MSIPSTGEISMNLFNTDRGIASGTRIDLAAAGTAYAVSYTTDGTNDLQMAEFRGKSSLYWTANRSGTFTRNNCAAGYTASSVTYSKTYTSYISQTDANNMASGDSNFNTEGQAYANANGTCTLYLSAATSYGCQSQAPNTGYINVSSYSGGSGAPYSFRYKLESAPDSSYSNWISGTGTTGAVLGNGAWMLQIRDGVGNTQNLYGFAISCNYPSITGTYTSGGSYAGQAYIRVTSITGGSGSGYFWYLSTDSTHRAVGDYALNLANGEYIIYISDGAGNVASFNPITFNLPPLPTTLDVKFTEVAPTSTNGGCNNGTNLTVTLPQGATFENASSFTNSYFTSYPTTVTIGYLSYNGRYVPVGKAYGASDTVQPFGSRADCPTQITCPSYGTAVSPAQYQCVGYTKQQKYNDGNCGYYWVDVETNSSYCGYTPPAGVLSCYTINIASNYETGCNGGANSYEIWTITLKDQYGNDIAAPSNQTFTVQYDYYNADDYSPSSGTATADIVVTTGNSSASYRFDTFVRQYCTFSNACDGTCYTSLTNLYIISAPLNQC